MDSLPDSVLRDILSFLPSKTFLPTCHVSKTFRRVWLSEDASHDDNRKLSAQQLADISPDRNDRKLPPVVRNSSMSAAGLRAVWAGTESTQACGYDTCRNNADGCSFQCGKTNDENITTPAPPRDKRLTSPLQIGNLFKYPWNKPARKSLNAALLQYYVENGWIQEGSCRMKRVMTGAAARGDIDGMEFIFDNDLYEQTDLEICTVAAAAGQLEALKWLREVRNHPWDPTEVHRESSENLHDDVMDYVEKNSQGHQIQLSYGVGLPW